MKRDFAIPHRLKASIAVESEVKKREFAIPANRLLITMESNVKTRIRYTSRSLESKYHYRIPGINTSSPIPANRFLITIESDLKTRTLYTSKALEI